MHAQIQKEKDRIKLEYDADRNFKNYIKELKKINEIVPDAEKYYNGSVFLIIQNGP